jgi:hypothetical protein
LYITQPKEPLERLGVTDEEPEKEVLTNPIRFRSDEDEKDNTWEEQEYASC